MTRTVRVLGTAAAALTMAASLTATLAACGAADQEGAAEAAAVRFVSSVASDPTTACGLLAPQTRKELEDTADQACRSLIAGEGIPADRYAVRTQVAGHSAQVVLEHQTVFLALFDSGWKVIAAGCEHTSSDAATPYECVLKGG